MVLQQLLTDFGAVLFNRKLDECLLSVNTQAKWCERTAVSNEDRKLQDIDSERLHCLHTNTH